MSIIYQYFLRKSCMFSLMHNSAAIFVHIVMVKQKTALPGSHSIPIKPVFRNFYLPYDANFAALHHHFNHTKRLVQCLGSMKPDKFLRHGHFRHMPHEFHPFFHLEHVAAVLPDRSASFWRYPYFSRSSGSSVPCRKSEIPDSRIHGPLAAALSYVCF